MSALLAPTITDALKPSEATAALMALINADQPTFVWGEPGVGKSSIVQQTGAALGLRVLDVRAALLDAVDLRGLPHVNGDGRAHWAVPEWLPRDCDPPTLLFLDELNRAPGLVMNGFFQLMIPDAFGNRHIGEYVAPRSLRIIAAGNKETHGGGVTRLSSALANRFCHIEVTPDLVDWRKWAIGAGIDPMIIGFLAWRPDLLQQFDPKANAFPTARSWEFVSRIVSQHAAPNIEFALIAGSVGRPTAVEVAGFFRTFRNLPSIDAILLNPSGAVVPTDVSQLYAVSAAMASRADDANWPRVVQYLDRLPQEYAVFAVTSAVTRLPQLCNTTTFQTWVAAHDGVTI